MSFLSKLFGRHHKESPIIILNDIHIKVELPKPSVVAKKIVFSSFIINNQKTEGIIMATQFGKAQKVPYTLAFLDGSGVVTTDPVTNVAVSSGDETVAKVDTVGGFVLGVKDGACTISVTAIASDGSNIAGSVVVTIADAPPPANVAKSIGITLGDPVTQ